MIQYNIQLIDDTGVGGARDQGIPQEIVADEFKINRRKILDCWRPN